MNHAPSRGFTLIETIMYLALFSILMGGAVVAAYNLFQSASRAHTIAVLQEEGDYLIAKTGWVLYGAKSINAPLPGTTGSTLTVVKWDGSVGNPVTLCVSANNLLLSTSSAPCDATRAEILNNADVTVTGFSVLHATSSGDGINPEFASTTLTLQIHTPNGAAITRSFFGISYLRQ